MQSKAATVEDYLAELPPDRRAAIQALRQVILRNLDKGYEEHMAYGMIGYSVPHRLYPPGYHCDPSKPLPFAGLASQKQYMSIYLMPLYGPDSDEGWFRDAWAATGKKLDMGKCCIRFKRLEDVPLEVIAEAIRRVPVATWIEFYERNLLSMNKAKAAKARANQGGTTSARPAAKRLAKPAARKAGKKTAKKPAAKKAIARR